MRESTLQVQEDDSRLEVAHVLLLLQGAMGLLSGAAMLLFMGGNPIALPLALGVPLLLFVLAAGVVRRWRWARKTAVILQSIILLAFVVSFLLGLLAQLDFSINLMTLITNVALPVALIRLLRRPKAAAVAVSADAGGSLTTASAA
ncbi:MAG TPA: hypothetical protein VIB47_05430 [Dehalococcoidia bacterium]|jgi:hypothetical protein